MRENIDPTQPTSEDFKISFEEYKLLLAWTNQLADRRQETSNIFFGVSGAIFAVLGMTLTQLTGSERSIGIILSTSAGIVVSTVWYFLLKRYREILRFKYSQLIVFEEILGLNTCGLVTAEESFFKLGKALKLPNCSTQLIPRRKIKKFGITLAEWNLALILLLIHLVVFIITIMGLLS